MNDAKETITSAFGNPYVAMFALGIVLAASGGVSIARSVQAAEDKQGETIRLDASYRARIELAQMNRDAVGRDFDARYKAADELLDMVERDPKRGTPRVTAKIRATAAQMQSLRDRSNDIDAKIILTRGEAEGRIAETEFYRRRTLAAVGPTGWLVVGGVILSTLGWGLWHRDHQRKVEVTTSEPV